MSFKFVLVFCFVIIIIIFFLLWRCDPMWVMASSFLRFLDHTHRRTTVGNYYYYYCLSLVFTVTYLKQTMFLGYTVLQLLCSYDLWYM